MIFSVHDTLASLLISEPLRPSCRLVLVSDQGAIMFELDLHGQHASGIQISPNAQRIAASIYARNGNARSAETYFATRDGKLLGSVPIGFTKEVFSNAGTDFVCLTNRNASLIDVANLSTRWSYSLPGGRMFLDVAWLNETVAVLSSDTPDLQQG